MSALRQSLAPLSLDQAREALSYCDGADLRDTWVALGRVFAREFGDAGYDAWLSWSEGGGKYTAKECRATWRGLSKGHGVGMGTLVHHAKQGGWQPGRAERLPTADELALRAALAEARRKQEAEAAAQSQEQAAAQAAQEWRQAQREGGSAYAVRKGLAGLESVRYRADGALLVPMLRYDLDPPSALVGLQTILPTGKKLFTPGCAKAGSACRLGPPVVDADAPIIIAEGYATGMSLRMAQEHSTLGARRWPVFVAFDAGNMPQVAEIVHARYPKAPLLIAADDDHATRIGGMPYNTGRIKADLAREMVMESDYGVRRVATMYPVFARERGPKDTDYNDLHRIDGLAAVAEQLLNAWDALQFFRECA